MYVFHDYLMIPTRYAHKIEHGIGVSRMAFFRGRTGQQVSQRAAGEAAMESTTNLGFIDVHGFVYP